MTALAQTKAGHGSFAAEVSSLLDCSGNSVLRCKVLTLVESGL